MRGKMKDVWICDYYKERYGYESLIFDSGFVAYIILGDQFYFGEFYISNDYRKSPSKFLSMMEKCTEIATQKGCTKFSCHVDLNAKNANEVLASRIKYGFKIKSTDGMRLGLVKELF